ncbi:diaminopimelate decarboxylase [Candidatus Methylopumilus planktonicus]|uniref:diaminopimelate decarboxylase n=1 Tax=Candidatus Methylopumilus planktonicus TaxID=1581557 RepID=UPI00111FD7CD|nr:diaminopimelate decarboxylase [Candidatus Methylopumilus planktonicus]QDD07445.1 diaminopimelate decarboxylase [Candidatus Methylopumilus planktonicus]QDD08774.1 diaminopimelate decarboxylase [Candidatus Methylopumilus planktonicus]QDD10096.1 diaminopimelate decarboxylase [Candidatus Methylopumilus planktonicus]
MGQTSFIHPAQGVLFAEGISLEAIAKEFGTPTYVYSKNTLIQTFESFKKGLLKTDHLICFAVKANSNIAILNLFASLGAGFDIVSGGELERVIYAGGDPQKIVFSGVGKTESEIVAALKANILCFNVESRSELIRIQEVAEKINIRASISIRVNPDVDAKTHPYISTGLKDNKFGVDFNQALSLYLDAKSMSYIDIKGIDCHIGSQITELNPFIDALDRMLSLVDQLKKNNIHLSHIDIGGGIGICYQDESPPDFEIYIKEILNKIKDLNVKIIFEPGRALVGNAGVLLSKVEYLKQNDIKHFAIIDAAMNDLMRPTLYDAYHEIKLVREHDAKPQSFDVVGPVCESGDFIAKNRSLALKENDLICIMSAGAYGMSMSSNYNSRGRAAEVMVDQDKLYEIRTREKSSDLFKLEKKLPL